MTARIPATDPDDRDTEENGTDVSVLASATYNARGQRTSCTLGTGMSCLWEYDPHSFRAKRVRSVQTSDSAVLQDLLYVYDAGGQVTDIFDRAQADVFFDNQRLAAHQHFVYDAWIPAASAFRAPAEAEAAAFTVFDANAPALSAWVTSGATGPLTLRAPFSGGAVLLRGASASTTGTSALLVLRGTGGGNWRIHTGYPEP